MKEFKTMFGLVTNESRVKTLMSIYKSSGNYFVIEDGRIVDMRKEENG